MVGWHWAALFCASPHPRLAQPWPPCPCCGTCRRHPQLPAAATVALEPPLIAPAARPAAVQPKPRDGVSRPPVIPPGVAEARARRDAGDKRKTEKDLQVCVCSPAVM